MIKKIIVAAGVVCAGALSLTACGSQPAEDTTAVEDTSFSIDESSVDEAIDEAVDEVIDDEATEKLNEDVNAEIVTEEITGNGAADEEIGAMVGDIISLSAMTDYAYEAGNLKIVEGDCVEITGKDSVTAKSEGTAIVECDLLDNETGTKTHTTFRITVM